MFPSLVYVCSFGRLVHVVDVVRSIREAVRDVLPHWRRPARKQHRHAEAQARDGIWRQNHDNMAEEEHNETDAVFLHLAGRNSLIVLVPELWRIFWRRKNQAMYSCCAGGPSEFSISYVFVYSAGSILLRSMDVILYRFESPRTPSRMWADSFFDFYIFSQKSTSFW